MHVPLLIKLLKTRDKERNEKLNSCEGQKTLNREKYQMTEFFMRNHRIQKEMACHFYVIKENNC